LRKKVQELEEYQPNAHKRPKQRW